MYFRATLLIIRNGTFKFCHNLIFFVILFLIWLCYCFLVSRVIFLYVIINHYPDMLHFQLIVGHISLVFVDDVRWSLTWTHGLLSLVCIFDLCLTLSEKLTNLKWLWILLHLSLTCLGFLRLSPFLTLLSWRVLVISFTSFRYTISFFFNIFKQWWF